jgi:hypothetical protein
VSIAWQYLPAKSYLPAFFTESGETLMLSVATTTFKESVVASLEHLVAPVEHDAIVNTTAKRRNKNFIG